MIQRTYTLNALNQDGLNAQLGAAFGALYSGFAVRETREAILVTVNLADSASQADIDQLSSLMASHDPQQLTPEQQARKAQADKLAAARRDDKENTRVCRKSVYSARLRRDGAR